MKELRGLVFVVAQAPRERMAREAMIRARFMVFNMGGVVGCARVFSLGDYCCSGWSFVFWRSRILLAKWCGVFEVQM